MKKILFFIFVFSGLQAWSQQTSVAAGGEHNSHSFTVGQVFQAYHPKEAQGLQFPEEYRIYVGVKEIRDLIQVYPNPVKDILTIVSGKQVFHKVYGLRGDLLISGEGSEVDFSRLPPSVYALKLSIGQEVKTLKIVKR